MDRLFTTPLTDGKASTHYRSARRHFRGGTRAAVRRAVTAARLKLAGTVPSVSDAADACGSCRSYVAAAAVVIQSENAALLNDVLAGRIALLAAAAWVAPLAALVDALRMASPKHLAAAGRTLGPEHIWNSMVLPAIAADQSAVGQPTADVSQDIARYLKTNGFGSLAEAGSGVPNATRMRTSASPDR
jgi:hypothetical protein